MDMRKFFLTAALVSAFALLMTSCEGGGVSPAAGKEGEIVVVVDRDAWEGDLGTTMQMIFESDYPCLPQSEPKFKLVNITKANLRDLFKRHRDVVIFEYDPAAAEVAKTVESNKWAAPQKVTTFTGRNSDELSYYLKVHARELLKEFEQTEREQQIARNKLHEQKSLREVVQAFAGGQMCFPRDWAVYKSTDNFVWIAWESKEVQMGVLMYKYPARDGVKALSAEALVERRNNVLRVNVPGADTADGLPTFMTTGTFIEPVVRYTEHDGVKVAELRGLWEMENDYMGGPFISHTFNRPETGEFVCLDAYVYAPKHNKRQYVRLLDSILYSFHKE